MSGSCSATSCGHDKTSTNHCNVVTCPNYWGDCPKHGNWGTAQ